MLHKNQCIQLNISVITIWKMYDNLLYIWLILKFNIYIYIFCFRLFIRSHGRVALLLLAWNSGLKLTTWWYICTRSTIIKTFIEQTLLRIENIRHTLWVMVACESLAPIIGNYYNKLWLPLKAGPRPRPKAPTTKKKKKKKISPLQKI